MILATAVHAGGVQVQESGKEYVISFGMLDAADMTLFKDCVVADACETKIGLTGTWTTKAIADVVSQSGTTGMYEMQVTAEEAGVGDWFRCKYTCTGGAANMATVAYYDVDIETANPLRLLSTTIATLATQVSFTLAAGSADDDAYNGMLAIVQDLTESTQKAIGVIGDYTGSTKRVTLREDPGVFTMAQDDKIDICAVYGDEVWNAVMANYTTVGTTGRELDDLPRTGIFVTAFGNAGTGTVWAETYLSPDTEPTNKILTGGESDDATMTLTAEIHTLGDVWQPVSVDLFRSGSALGLTVLRAAWTKIGDRLFTVTFTVTDASSSLTYHVETSDGKMSGDFAFVRGLDPPLMTSAAWDGTYPSAPGSPASLDTGIQTAVKSVDTVTVTGGVETHATRITVESFGATSASQNFDGDYSSGTFSIIVTIGSDTGTKQFRLKANKDGGAYGSTFDTTDSPAILLDQVAHSYTTFAASAFTPVSNFALKSGDSCTGTSTIGNWTASDKILYNFDDGTIASETVYVAAKTYSCTGGTYTDTGTNVQIDSRRKANGKGGTSQKTGLVKIANVAPTLTLTGATARLRSKTGADKTYALTLTGSQELKDTPTCVRDATDDGPAMGTWSGSEPDQTWTNTLTVEEDDTKNTGASNFSWEGIIATNGAGTIVAVIGTNPNYTVGGFEQRDIAIAKFDQFDPIGTMGTNLDNPNKLIAEYVGIGTAVYVTNTTDDPGSRKFTIVDGAGVFDPDGSFVKCNDSNIFDVIPYTIRIEESP